MMEKFIAPRTVQKEEKDSATETRHGEPHDLPLTALRDLHAYVLLGDPGLGKSTAFIAEAAALSYKLISAREFIALPQSIDQWKDKIIFIDGLDETRAGSNDGRSKLDAIRGKLQKLGHPKFRLSCRAADWLGNSDADHLAKQVPSGATFGVYHLKPLTEQDVAEILRKNFQVADTDAFIQQAQQNRLDELLTNPQTLEMLAKAVGEDNQWPSSRLETYQIAVDKLLSETNAEHKAAKQKTQPPRANLLVAAGYLSCLYLLADKRGFRYTEVPDSSLIPLNTIDNPDNLPLAQCLETRAFTALGDGGFAPVHRTVAEYLAAQFLAKVIDDHLPIGRVLAMMCGVDGGVVTGLRGLHAWLATCSASSRRKLIDNDPMGVLLYGDVFVFSAQEKIWMLEAIQRDAKFSASTFWRDWNSRSCAALATPDMAAEFERILRGAPKDRADELQAACVIAAIQNGERLPNTDVLLLDVVRTTRWPNDIRNIAMRAYLKHFAGDFIISNQLLEDIQQSKIKDSNDELLGALLEAMYPDHIKPSAVIQYLHSPKAADLSGSYRMFWKYSLLKKATNEFLAELLNAFAAIEYPESSYLLNDSVSPASDVLATGIEILGDNASDQTLFTWLGICWNKQTGTNLERDVKARLGNWFAERPNRYKGVLRIALNSLTSSANETWWAEDRLHGAPQPSDISDWWYAQALIEPNEALALQFFHNSFGWDWDGKLLRPESVERLEEWASQKPIFMDALIARRQHHAEQVERRASYRVKNQENADARQARKEYFQSILPKLLDNTVEQYPLYQLAGAYLGHYFDARGKTPIARLTDFLTDAALVEAGLHALMKVIDRSDLPTTKEVMRSYLEGKQRLLSPALLVALELTHQNEPAEIAHMKDEVLLTGLVSRYCYAAGNEPNWVEYLVTHKPELTAQACIFYVTECLKARKEYVHGIYQLAYDDKYAEVAKLTVHELLSVFPVKASVKQLSVAENLLKAALRYLPTAQLLTIIAAKLKNMKMDVGQRVYWLAVGMICNPSQYTAALKDFVSGNQIRCGHLGKFLYRGLEKTVAYDFSNASLALLIEMLGASARQERNQYGGIVTADMNRADLVRSWINQLASSPESDAAVFLQQLDNMPALKHWSGYIRSAINSQKIVMRDTHFKRPSVDDIIAVINKGKPANTADVAAIVNEMLREIADQMQTGNLNSYELFWNTDRYNKRQNDKVENGCRTALANLLHLKLEKYKILVDVERHHVDDKRSDIWCSHHSSAIPIETKVESNKKELWTALNSQLIAKYAVDPRAQGYGIYLVFWFGGDGMKSPPNGIKPTSAKQLAERLESQISPQHRQLISVHVLDCSNKSA
jgi:hypothetical protein